MSGENSKGMRGEEGDENNTDEGSFSGSKSSLESEVDKLTDLEVRIVTIIIDDLLHQLEMMSASKPKISYYVSFKDIKERFAERITESLQDTGVQDNLHEDEVKFLLKFQKERSLIIKILSLLKEELLANNSYVTLEQYLNIQSSIMEEEAAIRNTYEESSEEMDKFERDLEKSKTDDEEAEKNYKLQIETLRAELEESKLELKTQLTYNMEWEDAKYEQFLIKCKKTEEEITNRIKKLEFDLMKETQVHEDLLTFFDQNMKELNDQILSWTKRYEFEVEDFDKKIHELKQKRKEETERFKNLLNTYKKREKQITEYVAQRDERNRIAALERHRYNMATKIQAWWRGEMVRHHLGPYRLDKGKKKKKPKKKK